MSETKTGRVINGTVISTGMQKSITVQIERQIKHALYGKYIRRSTKICAHDENNECKVGDLVSITECRPLSKRKSFTLVKILESAKA